MTRPLPTAVDAAVDQPNTRPIYLVHMGWDSGSVDPPYMRITTWGSDIEWNGETWIASGAAISGMTINGGTLILPNGNNDVWQSLVRSEMPRGRFVAVYEYHDPDAVEIFTGIMNDAVYAGSTITISLIEGFLSKVFPPQSFNITEFPTLLTGGDRLYWGPDEVMIE